MVYWVLMSPKVIGRERFPVRDESPEPDEPLALVSTRCRYRAPEDDFFCLRYQVWYPSVDCAVRTRFRTAPGCANCDQGRFNARRHATSVMRLSRPYRRLAES